MLVSTGNLAGGGGEGKSKRKTKTHMPKNRNFKDIAFGKEN